MNVDEINHLSDTQQAELIADKFAFIQNQFEPINPSYIRIPNFSKQDIPQFKSCDVWLLLTKLSVNKSTVPGDLPPKLFKIFAPYLADPLTDILNTSLRRGEYPKIYKREISTPVPKVFPPLSVSQLRNISRLLTCDKFFEKLLASLITSDMKLKMDPLQYGNQKGIGIQHYLIDMIDKILSVLDSNNQKQSFAVISSLIDWDNAFSRQCPKLGVQSFIENGVRPGLVPLLISYFQDRQMSVKWHGVYSKPKAINGGGPQGATLSILECLSLSNYCADFVDPSERFRFIDDLTILEIVNLLTIGISSFNVKFQVPNDIPENNKFIHPENLKTQSYLDSISSWTQRKKMKINSKKSKIMIFNDSKNHTFATRLNLDNNDLEIINEVKLLGTIVTSDLKWNKNTDYLVKKANARMQLLVKAASFNPPINDLKTIYISFIRSLPEQCCVVWNSSLTEENKNNLERIQKSTMKIFFDTKYKGYRNLLNNLDMDTLENRRNKLCLEFAKKCVKNEKLKDKFPANDKSHTMRTRKSEKYKVTHARKEKYKKSAKIQMQMMLNKEK